MDGGYGASGRVPGVEAERPLSVQSGDPRGGAGQRARRAVSSHFRPVVRSARIDEERTLESLCLVSPANRQPLAWQEQLAVLRVSQCDNGQQDDRCDRAQAYHHIRGLFKPPHLGVSGAEERYPARAPGSV